MTDAQGVSTSKVVTAYITGTNDSPVINVKQGDASEATLPEGDAGLTTNGTLTVTDVDVSDVVEARVSGNISITGPDTQGKLDTDAVPGYMTVNAPVLGSGQTSGKLNWTFDSGNEAFNFLAQGNVLRIAYTIEVIDSTGAVGSQVVTVAITGTNDGPVIAVEAGDKHRQSLTEGDECLTASGTLTVSDVDLQSRVSVNVSAVKVTGTGGHAVPDALSFLTLSPSAIADDDEGAGNLGWKFNSISEAFNFLSEGEELVLTYTITATDQWDKSTTQDVTVTVVGTNDAASISGTTSGTVTEDSVTTTASGQLFAADVDNTANVFQPQTDVASTYGKFSIGTDGKWTYMVDNDNAAVNSLNTGGKLEDTFTVKSADGTEQVVKITINGHTDNSNPELTAPGQLGYATPVSIFQPGGFENVTYINRLVIADKGQNDTDVTVTLAVKHGTLEASSDNGVTVSGERGFWDAGYRVLTLTGKIADINAFIAGNRVEFDPNLGGLLADLNDELTVTINDGAGGSTTRTIDIKHSSELRTDWSGWNLNDVTARYGSENNTVVTSWSHGPSNSAVAYDGGERLEWHGIFGGGLKEVSNDKVTLVFTGHQLGEILSNYSHREQLDDFLSGEDEYLDLSGTAWNALVKNFEDGQLAVAAGPNSHVVYQPSAHGLADHRDLATGGETDDLLVASSSRAALNGSGDNDILVGHGGNNVLKGGEGADLLLGGAGNDELHGGAGHDILVGGSGRDTFVFDSVKSQDTDTIADFVIGQDEIDLSALLEGNAIKDHVNDYVRLEGEGADGILQVRTSGAGNWADVATLSGHGAENTPVKIQIDEHEFTITVI